MNVLNTSTKDPIETGNTIAEAPASPASTALVEKWARIAIASLTRISNANLIAASERILVGMHGNANYPAPVPPLSDITAAHASFVAAVSSGNGGAHAVADRRQKRTQLVVLLRSLALYVQQACNGDPVVLLSSGYPIRKAPGPVGLLPAPANLRLARGKLSGQLNVRCNADARASSYQWRYATAAAPAAWTVLDPTVRASIVLEGLVAGTVYVVQARAIGSLGPSDWSDVANLMVV